MTFMSFASVFLLLGLKVHLALAWPELKQQ
jgi:hypothetical protein